MDEGRILVLGLVTVFRQLSVFLPLRLLAVFGVRSDGSLVIVMNDCGYWSHLLWQDLWVLNVYETLIFGCCK